MYHQQLEERFVNKYLKEFLYGTYIVIVYMLAIVGASFIAFMLGVSV